VYTNFTVTDNRLVETSDYSPFSITAPVDPRLPDGGGYVVPGSFNLNPNKVGQVDNFVTFADNFGTQLEHWNGVDLTVNARIQGACCRRVEHRKDHDRQLRSGIEADNPALIAVDTKFLTQVKFLGTYRV
jgi:hypothetical protein